MFFFNIEEYYSIMFTSLVVLLKLCFSRGINLLMFYQLNCFLYSLDRFDLEVIFPNLVFLRQVNNCLFYLGKRQQNILFIGGLFCIPVV